MTSCGGEKRAVGQNEKKVTKAFLGGRGKGWHGNPNKNQTNPIIQKKGNRKGTEVKKKVESGKTKGFRRTPRG